MLTTSSQTTADRLLRIEDVLAIVGVSRSTLYVMMARNRFPRPVRVHERCVRWRESEVLEWVASRPTASPADWT